MTESLKRRLIVCCAVWVGTAMAARAEILIRLDQDEYQVSGPDENITIQVLVDADANTPEIEPIASGLFSYGIQLGFDSRSATIGGSSDITQTPELDYFGFLPGALKSAGTDFGAIKGNVDVLNDPLVAYEGSVLAEFSLTNLASAPEAYPLELDFFNTLGQFEEIFLDGNGMPLDEEISFQSAQVVVSEAGPALQAGDANQDLQFDQFDIVKVLVGAKYLTGQPATWGEGDWNGAPGGSPGSPPPGDGVFDQFDLIASLRAGLYRTGPYAAHRLTGFDDSPTGLIAVDPAQLDELQLQVGQPIGLLGDGIPLDSVPIPEPSTFVLVTLALILAPFGRRARSI